MQYKIVAYKVDCGYCETDSYGWALISGDIDVLLHEVALEHDNSYGYEAEVAQDLIDEGMDEDEAWETAWQNKTERVNHTYKVILETESEQEAEEALKHYESTTCPSTIDLD